MARSEQVEENPVPNAAGATEGACAGTVAFSASPAPAGANRAKAPCAAGAGDAGMFADLGYAKPDFHRAARQGVGEVVYGEGKTAPQIAGICQSLLLAGQPRVLVTRLDEAKSAEVQALLGAKGIADEGASAGADPDAGERCAASFAYYADARLGVLGGMPEADGNGTVVVAAAGTSDIPVAEEAALTAEFLGNRVERLYDVGVAGVHRLLAYREMLASAQVVIVVAGMEGALPSVVGGLVPCPVLAVPTSVGYGASFGGVAALLAMLNSCASGVSVVNIDNGFGAGYQASLINHLSPRACPEQAEGLLGD